MTADRGTLEDERKQHCQLHLHHPYRTWDQMIAPFRLIGHHQHSPSPRTVRSPSLNGPDGSPSPENSMVHHQQVDLTLVHIFCVDDCEIGWYFPILQSTEPEANEGDVNENEVTLHEEVGVTMVHIFVCTLILILYTYSLMGQIDHGRPKWALCHSSSRCCQRLPGAIFLCYWS